MDAFLPNFNEPTAQQTEAPAIADVKPNEPAPLAKPLTNLQGESVSPETLEQLKAYIEQCVVQTVSQAVTTVVPDVVEATLSRVSQPATVPQTTSPVRQSAIATDDYSDFTPGLGIGKRSTEAKSDVVAWLAMGGIVAAMAGLAAFSITQAPQAQTSQQNQQLTNAVTEQNQHILDASQQVLESKQRCGNFSLICNIKE